MDNKIIEIWNKLQKGDIKFYELYNSLVYHKENKCIQFYILKTMEISVISIHGVDIVQVGVLKVIENILRVYWILDENDIWTPKYGNTFIIV